MTLSRRWKDHHLACGSLVRCNCLPEQGLALGLLRSSLLERTLREKTTVKNPKHLQGQIGKSLCFKALREVSWDFDTEHLLWAHPFNT